MTEWKDSFDPQCPTCPRSTKCVWYTLDLKLKSGMSAAKRLIIWQEHIGKIDTIGYVLMTEWQD